jgi:hypothetical protein
MTLVGKIMAFFVLVFCLVAGGLMIMVYSTRQNWVEAYKKATDRLEVAIADRDVYEKELGKARQERDATVAKLQADVDAARKKASDLETTVGNLTAQIEAQKKLVTGSNAATVGAQGASSSHAAEVKTLQAQLVTLNKEIAGDPDSQDPEKREGLLVRLDRERQLRVQAEIERKTYHARNLELEGQLKDMARDLARVRTTGGTAMASRKGAEPKAPPDHVEGRIRTVDPTGQLLTITVGSDAGLGQGQLLEVFRLGSTPAQSKYLGTVEVLSVKPHEAVVRPSKKSMPALQVNDRVASKIMVGGS